MYDNKNKKIYPTLEPSAPELESQSYRLQTIKEIEPYLNNEIVERSRLEKKFENCSAVTSYINYELTVTTVITGSGGIASIAIGIGATISLGLGAISLASSLTSGIMNKLSRLYQLKAKKHHDITTTQTNLDGITLHLSKVIQDASISLEEFQQIVTTKQRYLVKKHELRSKSKKAVKELYAKQREELIEQGRQEDRKEIAKSSSTISIPTCKCYIDYELPPNYSDLK